MLQKVPKIAIICYSKTGHSRNLAERLALMLDIDVFDLHTKRYGMPFFGFLRAGFDSVQGKLPPLQHPLPDIAGYDAAIICGAVWTSYPATPLISYMQEETQLPAALGLVLTHSDPKRPDDAFAKAEQAVGRPFVAVEAVLDKEVFLPSVEGRLAAFAEDMRLASQGALNMSGW